MLAKRSHKRPFGINRAGSAPEDIQMLHWLLRHAWLQSFCMGLLAAFGSMPHLEACADFLSRRAEHKVVALECCNTGSSNNLG
jgi:hypothetical protein